MSFLYKYPRTPHLPFSPGKSLDDISIFTTDHFERMDTVVITEKLDGENTTMYSDYIHSRSLDGRNHISMNYVKNLWANIRYKIPSDYRICGENVFAEHSIHYSALENYFYVFSIWQKNTCLNLEETLYICEDLELNYVPILYKGKYSDKTAFSCFTGKSKVGGEQEGFVVRNINEFVFNEFSNNIAKYVRANHVQTNEHWKNKPITQNELKKNS